MCVLGQMAATLADISQSPLQPPPPVVSVQHTAGYGIKNNSKGPNQNALAGNIERLSAVKSHERQRGSGGAEALMEKTKRSFQHA